MALKLVERVEPSGRVLEEPLRLDRMTRAALLAVRKLFMLGNLLPLLHSKQRELWEQIAATLSADILIFCGRQWGKTHFGLCYSIAYCLKNPGSRVLYYAPVKEKLADIINDGLEVIMQWAPEGVIQRQKSSHRWRIGKSELRLCVLERAHVNKNRGINAKGLIVIEEGCFIRSDDFKYAYESIIEPQRLRYKPRLLLITTPSEDENHYVHKVLLPRLLEEDAVANYSIYDNPFLTDDDIEKVRAKVTEETWVREYCAKIFKSLESLATPEFTEDMIIEREPPAFANWLTIIDWGGLLDPHGLSLAYFDFQLGKYRAYREDLLPPNSTIAEVVAAAEVLEREVTGGLHHRIVDCPGAISTELSALNFWHKTPEKKPGSFEAGLNALRVGMKNSLFEVDPQCVRTIAQLRYGKLSRNRKEYARTEEFGHLDLTACQQYGFSEKFTTDPFPRQFDSARPFRAKDFAAFGLDSIAQSFVGLHDEF